MDIELVVFDIAGTTVSDHGDINDFFREAFSNAGIIVSKADVAGMRGYKKRDAIQKLVEKYLHDLKNKDEIIDGIHDDFRKKMINFYERDKSLSPLPFVEKVFHELQNNAIKVALNTGFTREITTPILKRLRWDTAPFIDAVICSDEVPEGRPYPYMIRQLMQTLGIDHAENVAKVGDTKVDIEEGMNAGCGMVVAVTTGAFIREQLITYHPHHIIDSLEELPSLIL